uniref:Uncharacterized protein n=1 Tax=Ciona savignyi TaxID=51511 RepID=H2YHY1_CIOSA
MTSLLNFLQDNMATNVDFVASQTHALNILMALVKDAALGEGILQYISRCIIVAVTGFSSSNWSIRNASTLFFTALTVRVFGVKRQKTFETSHKNRLSSYEFFTRFPKLHPFLLQHLQRNTASNDLVSQSFHLPRPPYIIPHHAFCGSTQPQS